VSTALVDKIVKIVKIVENPPSRRISGRRHVGGATTGRCKERVPAMTPY